MVGFHTRAVRNITRSKLTDWIGIYEKNLQQLGKNGEVSHLCHNREF